MADDTRTTDAADRAIDTRLALRRTTAGSVGLDGAWWPRTQDGLAELTVLVAALDAEQVRVTLLMLNPHGWYNRPRRVDADGRRVRIEWITMLDRSVVTTVSERGERVDLHLVTPVDDPGRAPPGSAPHRPPERATLRTALAEMTRVLKRSDSDAPGTWLENVRVALLTLLVGLDADHGDVRTLRGRYLQLVVAAPRLSNAVAKLHREHVGLRTALERALLTVAGSPSAAHRVRVRAEGTALVRDLVRYRQRDADLLHQADHLDLGGQG